MRRRKYDVGTTSTSLGELAIQVIRQQATAFAEHAPQARAGSDPEHVHQTRVATRRLRAALRVFRDVLPPELDQLRDELKWIAAHLGEVRDLDVQLTRLQSNAEQLAVGAATSVYRGWLEGQRRAALAAFEDAFQSDRFVALTERLQCVSVLSPDQLPTDAPVADAAPRRLRRAYRQLKRCADQLTPESPVTEFHQARIRAKRLRYAGEFFESVSGKGVGRLIKRATQLQDLLGDHQDGIVSAQRIHAAIDAAGDSWPAETILALGQIVQLEAQHGAQLRLDFATAYRKVKRAWQRLPI